MKTLAPALLLIALCNCLTVQAATTPAQTEDVREAVFRALMVRAKTVMPEAKVYILEKENDHPLSWGNGSWCDPSDRLMQRFTGHRPPVIALTEAGAGASETETWHEDGAHERGLLLQIVSLHWTDDKSVEAETYMDAGLPRPAVSIPYSVTLQEGLRADHSWTVREDVAKEWWQAVHEGSLREAVVRYELAQGVYGIKPGKSPCYLSFGGYTDTLVVDPSAAFMERFAKGPIQLRKASECPKNNGRNRWLMFGIQDVRWISETQAEVDGGGTHSQSMSADSILYEVTQSSVGWKVQPTLEISI